MSRKKYHHKLIFLDIGKRIRQVRGNLTQGQLAKILEVKQNTVSRWEKWGVAPDEDTLKKLAEFGGVTIEWLLRGQAHPAGQLAEMAPENGYVASLNPLETSLLVAVISQIEVVINKRKIKMPPDQKARLVVRVYDDCRAQQLQPDAHLVERALLLVD